MEINPPKKIKIEEIKGKGRGVVATKDIFAGEIIETCPIIYLFEKESNFIENTAEVLKFYYLFQSDLKKYCLMLGYGSLYNHSKTPNADIDYDDQNPQNFVVFKALKDIKAGQEIVYDYEFEDNKEDFLNLN